MMLDKIILTILSRGELSLSLLIAAVIIIYFYIKGVAKDIKTLIKETSEHKDTLDSIQDKIFTLKETTRSLSVKLEALENRIEKAENRIDKTDDMIVSLSLSPTDTPGIGNGHKKLYAKIIAAISKSISDSYDYTTRTLFFMWMEQKLPDKNKINEALADVFKEIENIQQHAVEILPERINGIEIRDPILNLIRTCLEHTKEAYFSLSEAIIELLNSNSIENSNELMEIIFYFLGEAQTAEIQIYSDELSKQFTEAIKSELETRQSFIKNFLDAINESTAEILAEKITAKLSKITIDIFSVKKRLEQGEDIKKLVKELKSGARKKKRTTKKN